MGKYLEKLEREDQDPIKAELESIKQKISNDQDSTRRRTYKQLNVRLESPEVYHNQIFIPEHHRIAFTRFRVGSHRFRIETGRWSRTPRERRLCPCGEVQDEVHVIKNCVLLRDVRARYSDINYDEISEIMNHGNIAYLSKYIYDITKKVNDLNGCV